LNTVVRNGATSRTSKIRNYFSVERDDDLKAQCNHCSAKLVRGSNLKAFGNRSYSDETSQHVGCKATALAQRSDEPPAKKSKMALETLPFLYSWRQAVHCRKITTRRMHHQSQIQLHSCGNAVKYFSVPVGVPQHLFLSRRKPCKTSFHPRRFHGIPEMPLPVQVSNIYTVSRKKVDP